jgi:hypothetical protein
MPVQKFRSIEEMNRAVPLESVPADFDRFLRHCARYWAIAPRTYPRGVFKFRSIEHMRHPSATSSDSGSQALAAKHRR